MKAMLPTWDDNMALVFHKYWDKNNNGLDPGLPRHPQQEQRPAVERRDRRERCEVGERDGRPDGRQPASAGRGGRTRRSTRTTSPARSPSRRTTTRSSRTWAARARSPRSRPRRPSCCSSPRTPDVRLRVGRRLHAGLVRGESLSGRAARGDQARRRVAAATTACAAAEPGRHSRQQLPALDRVAHRTVVGISPTNSSFTGTSRRG